MNFRDEAELIFNRNQSFYGELRQLKKAKGIKNISATATGRFSENQIAIAIQKTNPDLQNKIFTGFVRKDGQLSQQVDIIVANRIINAERNFVTGDFAIVDCQDVAVVIEVKNDQKFKQDVNQMKRIKELLPEVQAWLVWVTFRGVKRNREQRLKEALDLCSEKEIGGAIVAIQGSSGYQIDPSESFSNFLGAMKIIQTYESPPDLPHEV